MPPSHKFHTQGGYYESILHNLGHWSEVRTEWDSKVQGYPLRELAAEMAACLAPCCRIRYSVGTGRNDCPVRGLLIG